MYNSLVGTYVYILLAIIALGLTVLFIYLAKKQDPKVDQDRKDWATSQSYTYSSNDRIVGRLWYHGIFATTDVDRITNLCSGMTHGDSVAVFDIKPNTTIVAVRRDTPSSVVIDIRDNSQPLPHEDLVSIGTIANRTLYSNNPTVAQRVSDKRLAEFTRDLPPYVECVWCEGPWSLAIIDNQTPITEYTNSVKVVKRFSDLMQVLPPRSSTKNRGIRTPNRSNRITT